MSDTDRIYDAISTKLPAKTFYILIGILVLIVRGCYGFTYQSTSKLAERDWDLMEHQVTKEDFKEFKDEIKFDLRTIQTSIDNLRRDN